MSILLHPLPPRAATGRRVRPIPAPGPRSSALARLEYSGPAAPAPTAEAVYAMLRCHAGMAETPWQMSVGLPVLGPIVRGGHRHLPLRAAVHAFGWPVLTAWVSGLGIGQVETAPDGLVITGTAPARWKWATVDAQMDALEESGLDVDLALCWGGVPEGLGPIHDEDFPNRFAVYADAVQRRYPFIRRWTPIVGLTDTARMSGRVGRWNDVGRSATAYAGILRSLCRGYATASAALAAGAGEIVFSEVASVISAAGRVAEESAAWQTGLSRFAVDLVTGAPVDPSVRQWMLAHGWLESDLALLANRAHAAPGAPGSRSLGLIYSPDSEQRLDANGGWTRSRAPLGFRRVAADYAYRTALPIRVQGLRAPNATATHWLRAQLLEAALLRRDGVPVLGMSWGTLMDLPTMREDDMSPVLPGGPVGLYSAQGGPKAVARTVAEVAHEMHAEVRSSS